MTKSPEDQKRDEVLRRMLSTPPNHRKIGQEKGSNGNSRSRKKKTK